MKNTSNKQQQKSDLIFHEYDTAAPGQHSIAVLQRQANGKKEMIARIYRSWDEKNGKFLYTAKDVGNKPLFDPTHNLFALKKQFREQLRAEKSLQQETPAVEQDAPEKSQKQRDLAEVREKKGQDKGKGIER